MKQVLSIGPQKQVSYEIRKYARSRCIRISIRPQGVLVTAPKRTAVRDIKKFVESRSAWIVEHFTHIQEKKRSPRETERLRAMTRERVWEMLEYVNARYQYNFERVFIRDVVSRWGSCSSSGNLNFSIRAGLLSDSLLEYLVAHELCHLKEMNHSSRFWDLVAREIPDYRSRRRALNHWREGEKMENKE